MMRFGFKALLSASAMALLPAAATAATFSVFGPGVFSNDTAAMDAALGITGYRIEDFEDVTMLPDLTVRQDFRNGAPPSVMSGALPRVQASGAVQAPWDGSRFLTSYFNNKNQGAAQQAATVTFSFDPSSAFGLGLSGFGADTLHDITVVEDQMSQQVLLQSLTGFVASDTGHNGYVVITAAPDAVLTSVSFSFRTPLPSGAEDYVTFDRLALNPAPVPLSGTLPFLAIGLSCFAAMRRRS